MIETYCSDLDAPCMYPNDQIDFSETRIDAKTHLWIKFSTTLLIWSKTKCTRSTQPLKNTYNQFHTL